MSGKSFWRSIRNWPKKAVGLHKIDYKIDRLEQSQQEQRQALLRLEHMQAELSAAGWPGNAAYYHNLLNMGETMLAARAGSESGESAPNIYSFIKRYSEHIDTVNMQYFLDLAADFCGRSFTSQHYAGDFIAEKVKNGRAEAFIKELRENYLFPAELDLTANHSISRPFRFWRAAKKQAYIRTALAVIAALRELSPYCCCGYGTALAARRERRGAISILSPMMTI